MSVILSEILLLPYVAKLLIVIAIAYFFGAIPWSLIVGKLFFRIDLRQVGSGNLGTTNAFRILGAKAGIAVLILDMAKGALSVILARYLAGAMTTYTSDAQGWLMIAAALAAIVGHTASPYVKFRGGKGAATTAGVMLALLPMVFIIAITIFVLIVALIRYVSVATLTVAISFPLWTILFYPHLPYILLSLVVAIIVTYAHRANIKRLREGSEARFSWRGRGSGRSEDSRRDDGTD